MFRVTRAENTSLRGSVVSPLRELHPRSVKIVRCFRLEEKKMRLAKPETRRDHLACQKPTGPLICLRVF
ncbi:unnamed protein product [Rangifer tarandus platyrhynchus]|uniref:Uncharacterized protein n=1 Tax=Rangifer tarandus platyrhynchus TaxID=3082113 RepID=A0ABN8Y0P9_RANTA|nr:unnamed protein product [Rangifer tarandus platyrhynchus]